MRKHFEHSTRPDITIGIADVDKITDEEFITGKFNKMEEEKRIIDKSDIINGKIITCTKIAIFYIKNEMQIKSPMFSLLLWKNNCSC